jgi:hypothetical protein
MDTPNAIAKAFMEVPHAVAVKEYLEHAIKDRAAYQSRMAGWNVAESQVALFRHPKSKHTCTPKCPLNPRLSR